MRVKPQARISNLASPESKKSHQVRSGDRFSLCASTLEINTHRRIQICIMAAEVEKASGACCDRTSRGETGVFHEDGLAPDRILLGVKEQSQN